MNSKRSVFSIALLVIAGLFVIGMGSKTYEDVDADKYQVRQRWVTGSMDAKLTPGVWLEFGQIMEFPKAETFYGTADNDGGTDSDEDRSVNVRFADGSEADISFTARVEMPRTKDGAIALVKDHSFRDYRSVEDKLLLPVFRRAMRSTANLMTARESYSEKRNDFIALTWDQVQNGPYITKAVERKVIDPISGEEVTRTFQDVVLDDLGNPTYQDNPLNGKNIELDNFEIKDFAYRGKVNDQIEAQQEALMAVATAKAEAQQAEQEKIKIAAQGKAKVETAKYEMEQVKIREVTEAEKRKAVAELKAAQELEVAKLAKLAAEQTKAQQILLGEGEAKRKRLNMEADGALQPKLDAWLAAQKAWAVAVQNYSGNWVPVTVMGSGANGTPGGNGAQDMIDLLTVKTAQDLSLDMSVKASSK